MLVKAVREFSHVRFGNIDVGRVFEMKDAEARYLIECGLVVESANPLSNGAESSFQSPVGADQSGLSSQAGQVSTSETADLSESGKRKTTYRKRKLQS